MNVQRFRKRPVEVDAVQLTRENFDDVGEWAGVKECWELHAPSPGLFIETRDGLMKASLGDYVIREPFPTDDRQFYPHQGRRLSSWHGLLRGEARRGSPGRQRVVEALISLPRRLARLCAVDRWYQAGYQRSIPRMFAAHGAVRLSGYRRSDALSATAPHRPDLRSPAGAAPVAAWDR